MIPMVEKDGSELVTQSAKHGEKPTSRSNWLVRTGLVLALILAGTWLFAWLFAAYLVVQQSPDSPTHVLLLDAVDSSSAAAAWARDHNVRVLSVERVPARPMQLGVLPTFEDFTREELRKRGISPDRYEVIPGPVTSPEQVATALDAWMENHPTAEIVALCDLFSGRRWRTVFDATLDPDRAGRLYIQAVPRRDYDRSNWWAQKKGWLDLGKQYLQLVSTWTGR